jgi:hypothetical protein
MGCADIGVLKQDSSIEDIMTSQACRLGLLAGRFAELEAWIY